MRPSVVKVASFLLRSLTSWIVYCRRDHMQLLLFVFFVLLMIAGHTFPPLAFFTALLALGAVRVVQLVASLCRSGLELLRG